MLDGKRMPIAFGTDWYILVLLNLFSFDVIGYYQEKLTNPDDDFAYCLKGIVTGALFNSPFKLFEENSKSTFSHKWFK